jgi:plastocyanin
VLVLAVVAMTTISATDPRITSHSTQISSSFVTRDGAQLLLNGQPFTFTGVNIYNANSDGWCRDELTDADLQAAFHALGHGQVVIRAWFFQPLATKKWTGERDWTRFDRTIALAREAGVHIIATLTDQWGECGDGGNGVYKTRDWYRYGYLYPDPAQTDPEPPRQNTYAQWTSYSDYVAEVVDRYKSEPTIMAWQLINEAEVKVAATDSTCATAAPPPPPTPQPSFGSGPTPTPPPPPEDSLAVLKAWATAMADEIRGYDPNHLISLGTIGSGQCGASGAEYQELHSIPNIDLCEYHDYSLDAMPGDQWNGLQVRLDQCAALGKPLFVGETGIKPTDVGGMLEDRSALFDLKFSTQFAAGAVGELMWDYSRTPSTFNDYDIGPGDPALRRFQTAPEAPTGVIAAAGSSIATVTWRAPSWDGGTAVLDYTIFGNGTAIASAPASATTANVAVTNGTTYTFTVAARNAIGIGAASIPSGPVTPQAGAPPPAVVSSDVPPGSSATVATGPGAPTPQDPLITTVVVPSTAAGGSISVVETAPSGSPPSGYQFMGQQIDIVSTAATSPTNPLTITFAVDESVVRSAYALGPADPLPLAENVDITRAEGSGTPVVIAPCTAATPPIAPDPCVASRAYVGGDLQAVVVTGSASHWASAVRPAAVTVTDGGYAPRLLRVREGSAVVWTFAGTRAHTVTDASRLGTAAKPALFNSGPMVAGRFGYVFRAAGTYSYGSLAPRDPANMTGAVEVPVLVSPASGTTTTTFTVTWSSGTIAGYVFDISYRFQKAGTSTWTESKWQAGQTATGARFTPSRGPGTYALIARLRNSSTGNASLWSPETRIVVRAP